MKEPLSNVPSFLRAVTHANRAPHGLPQLRLQKRLEPQGKPRRFNPQRWRLLLKPNQQPEMRQELRQTNHRRRQQLEQQVPPDQEDHRDQQPLHQLRPEETGEPRTSPE